MNDDKKKSGTEKGKMHEPESGGGFQGPKVNLVSESMGAENQSPNWLLAVIILVFTIAVWVIIGGIGESRERSARAQIENDTNKIERLNTSIASLQEQKNIAQKVQKQFEAVDSLVQNHLYWSPVLEMLEELTIPDVYYTRMNADIISNEVTIEAVTKNYDAAARQIRAFELAPDRIADIFVGEARVENQPGAELPVPIVKVELQLTLREGILSFDLPAE